MLPMLVQKRIIYLRPLKAMLGFAHEFSKDIWALWLSKQSQVATNAKENTHTHLCLHNIARTTVSSLHVLFDASSPVFFEVESRSVGSLTCSGDERDRTLMSKPCQRFLRWHTNLGMFQNGTKMYEVLAVAFPTRRNYCM